MTPFDVAISKGQAECVKVLLRHSDIDGDAANEAIMAPLHHAARKGHSKIVTYLLAKDAQIDKCWLVTEELRKTALDIALDYKKEEVAKILLSSQYDWESLLRHRKYDLNEKDAPIVTPMRRMIKDFPALAKQAMDLCKQPSVEDKKDGISYNFEFIDDTFVMPLKQNGKGCGKEEEEEIPYDNHGNVKKDARPYSENRIQIYKEHPLMLMIKSKNEDSRKLLDHDLVKTMLKNRWKSFGIYGYFWLSFFPDAAFLFFFTCMIINIDRKIIETNEKSRAVEIENIHVNVTFRDSKEILQEVANKIMIDWVTIVFVLIFFYILVFKELYQCIKLTGEAYINWENWGNLGELVVYFLSLVTILWRISALGSKDDLSDGFWIFASFVFAIPWFNLLMLLSKLKYVGLFIVMFIKVGKSFGKIAATFIPFIMMFSFSFLVLIHKKEEFSKWYDSAFKTFMMSTGEIDYSDIFFDEPDHFEERSFTKYFTMVLFLAFVFFIVILVHNLFTGVAVGNIEEIMKEAKLEELAIEAECLLMQATLSENIMRSQKYRHWVRVNHEDWTLISEIVSYWQLHWKAIGTYFGSDFSCCTSCSCCSANNEDQAEDDRRPGRDENGDDSEKRKKEANKLKKSQEDDFLPEDPIKKLVVNNEKMILDLKKEVKNLKTELTNQKDQIREEIAVQNQQIIRKTEEKFDIIIQALIVQREHNQILEEQLKQIQATQMNKIQESPAHRAEDEYKEFVMKFTDGTMNPIWFEVPEFEEPYCDVVESRVDESKNMKWESQDGDVYESSRELIDEQARWLEELELTVDMSSKSVSDAEASSELKADSLDSSVLENYAQSSLSFDSIAADKIQSADNEIEEENRTIRSAEQIFPENVPYPD